jgi:transposase/DNA replication protein DnaC
VRLYPPPRPRSTTRVEPDFAALHQELKRPGVTLQLLWEEYRADSGQQAYRYSAYCEKYRAWAKRLKRSMRQVHPGGERLFVDYAGQTVPVVDATSGEIRRAQVFVAVLGASNYTYACATWQQTAADWVASIIDTLGFIGGVPRLLVPDQPRALIANPDAYEPATARLMQELGEHYGVAVLPARPGRPQDKAKVEVGVQVVERWILARLRNRRLFSLAELNRAIAELLADLNQRPFKKLPGCRASAFVALDALTLKPLPATAMVLAQFKPARVNIDYHVAFEGHYYSVPHQHVGAAVELRITASTLEVLLRRQRIAAHVRSAKVGGFTTVAEHMPASHRAHLQWTPAKLIAWGERVGAATAGVVRWQMAHRAASRAGLPLLPGPDAPGPGVRRRAPGGRLRPRAVHPRAQLPQRQVDPGLRPGSSGQQPAGWHRRAHARARQRARARLLRAPLMATATTTHPNPSTTTDHDTAMLQQHTLDQLRGLRLDGMIAALADTGTQAAAEQLPFEQRLALLVQREMDWRDGKRVARLVKAAKLKVSSACMEDIDWRAGRGLDRHLITALAGGDWIRHGRNVLITGATGCGKTWLGCALAQQAARQGFSVLYSRATRLLQELQVAHGDGSFGRRLAQLARLDVLVLDDLAIAPIAAQERQDLLELLDDRVGSRSTLITSQLPTSAWHQWLNEPTIADAIMDRLLHGSHTLALKGESLRRAKAQA